MVSKLCPVKRYCLDKGTCDSCPFGEDFDRYSKKIKNLKAKNKELSVLNNQLKKGYGEKK